MTDDSEYTYELCSSCCAASRLSERTNVRLGQSHGLLLFEERTDLNFGVLDKLLASGVLNEVEYDDVKASQSTVVRHHELAEYKARKRSFDIDFVAALQSTKQQHL